MVTFEVYTLSYSVIIQADTFEEAIYLFKKKYAEPIMSIEVAGWKYSRG